jgi:hypothetical protein
VTLNIGRIERKDTTDLVYMYAKSENRQMTLHATLPCAWVGPAKLSRVVMMIADRHSIQYFSQREDFPLLTVKLGIVVIFFFHKTETLKFLPVWLFSLRLLPRHRNITVHSQVTKLFFMYFVISLLTSIDMNKQER